MNNDIIPSYRLDNLPETFNDLLLKKTNLTMKENDSVMKKSNLSEVEHSLSITAYTY